MRVIVPLFFKTYCNRYEHMMRSVKVLNPKLSKQLKSKQCFSLGLIYITTRETVLEL